MARPGMRAEGGAHAPRAGRLRWLRHGGRVAQLCRCAGAHSGSGVCRMLLGCCTSMCSLREYILGTPWHATARGDGASRSHRQPSCHLHPAARAKMLRWPWWRRPLLSSHQSRACQRLCTAPPAARQARRGFSSAAARARTAARERKEQQLSPFSPLTPASPLSGYVLCPPAPDLCLSLLLVGFFLGG
jgi:hypothetical protein